MLLQSKGEDGVNIKEGQTYMEADPDEKEMEYVALDYGRYNHRRMVFEDIKGG